MLSTASDAITAQTAASNAFPPSLRTWAPASAVSGCPAATTPLLLMGVRVLPCLSAGDELRHVEVDRRLLARAPHARLARGLPELPRAGPARRPVSVPGRHDRDPAL